MAEQHEIVSEVEARLSIVQTTEQVLCREAAEAARLRQSILKRAFEGKLVPQDPNDEPAEKLLERIREARAKVAKSQGGRRTAKRQRGRNSQKPTEAKSQGGKRSSQEAKRH